MVPDQVFVGYWLSQTWTTITPPVVSRQRMKVKSTSGGPSSIMSLYVGDITTYLKINKAREVLKVCTTFKYYLRIRVSWGYCAPIVYIVIFKVWELIRRANSQAPPPAAESETGLGPPICVLIGGFDTHSSL